MSFKSIAALMDISDPRGPDHNMTQLVRGFWRGEFKKNGFRCVWHPLAKKDKYFDQSDLLHALNPGDGEVADRDVSARAAKYRDWQYTEYSERFRLDFLDQLTIAHSDFARWSGAPEAVLRRWLGPLAQLKRQGLVPLREVLSALALG